MEKVVLLVILAAIVIAVAKVKSDLSSSRKETLQRINIEHEAKGSLSPTADLFRESGVPVPEAMAEASASNGGSVSTMVDLATIFAGITLPASMSTLDAPDPHHLVLSSPDSASAVHDTLDAEFTRLGLDVTWASDVFGSVTHSAGGAASVTIAEGEENEDKVKVTRVELAST